MSEDKFKFSKAYPSNHLRCADLEDKEVTLTIKEWAYPNAKDDTGGDGKIMQGTVLLFKESPKRFIANVTNYRSIKALHGIDPDAWVGKKIRLKPDTTKFGREVKECIRISPLDPETGKVPNAF
jgi:hypothetical protein